MEESEANMEESGFEHGGEWGEHEVVNMEELGEHELTWRNEVNMEESEVNMEESGGKYGGEWK